MFFSRTFLLSIILLSFTSCGFINLGGFGSSAVVYHKVRSGETLYSIGRKYGVRYESIALQNGIHNPSKIYAGQRLLISYGDKTRRKTIQTANVSRRAWGNSGNSNPKQSTQISGKLLWPVRGGRITSRFGPRRRSFHDGIDFAAPSGTPVYAAHSGKVAYSGNGLRGYGNMIVLRSSTGISTVYAHNRRLNVRKNQIVSRGQKIAEVGSTGRSTGPHLHFEVRVKNRRGRYLAVDPMPFLRK